MGASGWGYFTLYQPDIDQALQDLRQKEFEAGHYYFASREHSRQRPKTIQELLQIDLDEHELGDKQGTHSIIDIKSISPTPDFETAAPLSAEQLIEFFGTDKPTHAQVEAKAYELQRLRLRWQGSYLIVYRAEEPAEIFFTGFSGD